MSPTPFAIRAARPDDLPAILAIFNELVLNSTAVYTEEPVSLADRSAWYRERVEAGFPVLVAVAAGDEREVLGFASYGPFRGAWPGYRHTVEHSVHIRADRRGQGIGGALIQALFPLAQAAGVHVMLGVIDADNQGSLRLHQRLGFEQAGRLVQVGRKFGRWLDVVFVQRMMNPDEGASRDDRG